MTILTIDSTIIQSEVLNDVEVVSMNELVKEVALVLLILTVLGTLIWLLNRLLRVIKLRLIRYFDKKLNVLSGKGFAFFRPRHVLTFITNTINVIRFVSIIILIYISLPLIFSVFPWTRDIGLQLIDAVINPVKLALFSFINYLPNILTIIVIYFITRYILKFFNFIASEIESGNMKFEGFYQDWAMPTYNIVRSLLYVFMFVIIFPYLPGSNSKVFQGVSVFLGVLLSFGSSSAISNIVAGIVLTYMRPFQIGDRVLINTYLGDVVAKNLLVTRLRTIKNEDITIPNSNILNSSTINYTIAAKEEQLILHTTITIGYDSEWKQIHELLINAGKNSIGVCNTKEPFVLQTSLSDFYVAYELNVYVNNVDLPKIYSELHKNIQDQFNKAGVEIMSPHYTSLRDGNNTAIPNQYLGNDYVSPGFKINK